MIRRIAAALAGAAIWFAATPAFAQTAASPEPALVTLHVATGTENQATPLLYGVSSGLFRRAGLDVQIVKMNSGSAVASAVAGGAIDIGKSGIVPVITAHAHNAPFTMVSGSTYYIPAESQMIVAATSSIHDPKDLAGKTIGVGGLADIFALGTRAWLGSHGVDPTSTKFLELPLSSAPVAITQNRIDAATLYEPILQQSIESGQFRVVGSPLDALGNGKRFQVSAWFTTTDWANSHRDALDKFLRVMREASAYVDKNYKDVIPLLAAFTNTDAAIIARMPVPRYAQCLAPQDIQGPIDVAAKYGFIDKSFPAAELISPYALKC
jgi:NitT/TauT family transport system substrate-binding protein